MPKCGDYHKRVTVWRNSSSRSANTDGQRPESGEEFCRRWANVIPMRSRERFLAKQTKQDVTHVVVMRWDSQTKNITSAYWLTLPDGTRLDIKSIFDVDGKNYELELECNQRR